MSKRVGVMLAKPLTPALLTKMPSSVVVQAKLDGDRCRAVPITTGYTLYSRTDRCAAVPHILPALEHCARAIWGSDRTNWQAFDGELPGVSHQAIRSIVSRRVNSSAAQYHVFDPSTIKSQLHRLQWLTLLRRFIEQVGPTYPIQAVPSSYPEATHLG
jgi:hypothetical protein